MFLPLIAAVELSTANFIVATSSSSIDDKGCATCFFRIAVRYSATIFSRSTFFNFLNSGPTPAAVCAFSFSAFAFSFRVIFFVSVDSFSQEVKEELKENKNDSIVYKSPYGIRLGLDISKPIKSFISNRYDGFEIIGDYRISKRFFIAAELGFEEENTIEDYTNSTVKGNYIRLGFNYNAYENWLDMNNEIFLGFRYGFSLFDQTLNSYTPNVNNTYFPANTITTPITASDLNAHWSELIIGIKVETFKNFFISTSVSYKVMMSVKDPENFKSLYSPGFNRIFESSTGFGFNYTLSYLIPFKKK